MIINLSLSGDRALVHGIMLELVSMTKQYGVKLEKLDPATGVVTSDTDKLIRASASNTGGLRVR